MNIKAMWRVHRISNKNLLCASSAVKNGCISRTGVAPGIFQWEADSSDEGAKIWF